MSDPWQLSMVLRWLKFNLVGIIGACLQTSIVAACTYCAKLGYLPATILAVECAILHKFICHERFTWRDRPSGLRLQRVLRLFRFNTTNGAVSRLGNVLLMRLLKSRCDLKLKMVTWSQRLIRKATLGPPGVVITKAVSPSQFRTSSLLHP